MKAFDWFVCSLWELSYKNLIRARYVKGSQRKLLRVVLRRYRGHPIQLPSCRIVPGDLVAELHISNFALRRYSHVPSPRWAIHKDMLQEMRLLNQMLLEQNVDVKALWAITLLAAPALRLGFTVQVIPPSLWPW